MRLYHFLRYNVFWFCIGGMAICSNVLCSCSQYVSHAESITVIIEAAPPDQAADAIVSRSLQVPSGSTVSEALSQAKIVLGPLDRVAPPLYQEVTPNLHIKVTRRSEEFVTEKQELPFTRQMVKNLNLPRGEMRLLQAGENGLEEITIRRVYEDGSLVSAYPIKRALIKEPVEEIIMIGIQQPFTPQPIAGKLAYLSGGNAWIMSQTTAERKPLITNGKLDGRVFSLSADGKWLLFTQKEEKEEKINSLWVVSTDESGDQQPIALGVENIVHYADWIPNKPMRVAFSTVEPRSTPPGWQANNDLYYLDFSSSGWVSKKTEILPPQIGGVYGWWGTNFLWSPDGLQCAYSRADQIGLVSFSDNTLQPLIDLLPFQTYGDWAWVSPLSWSPDGRLLYYIDHRSPAGEEKDETAPYFDLSVLTAGGVTLPVIPDSGMFAFPAPSPLFKEDGEDGYLLAYLKAIFPEQSQTSRYRLYLADRDGSNKRLLFPAEDLPGLEPQKIVWSPEPIYGKMGHSDSEPRTSSYALAVVYQGDIWLIEANTGATHQITADGLISKIDWK